MQTVSRLIVYCIVDVHGTCNKTLHDNYKSFMVYSWGVMTVLHRYMDELSDIFTKQDCRKYMFTQYNHHYQSMSKLNAMDNQCLIWSMFWFLNIIDTCISIFGIMPNA